MKVDIPLDPSMKIDGICMTRLERGLQQLACVGDATNEAETPREAALCDAAFASTARAVARDLSSIATGVQARPVGMMRIFRSYVAEEAAKAPPMRAYGSYAQWRSLAAKLLLPGVDHAIAGAA